MAKNFNEDNMLLAIKESAHCLKHRDGGPFGAVVAKDGKVIAKGHNCVLKNNDCTAHAEIQAIRKACKKLKTFSLEGCVLYTSCEPCPMCLSAIMWARIDTVYYAATRKDVADIGFDDSEFYDEIAKSHDEQKIEFKQICQDKAQDIVKQWSIKEHKKMY